MNIKLQYSLCLCVVQEYSKIHAREFTQSTDDDDKHNKKEKKHIGKCHNMNDLEQEVFLETVVTQNEVSSNMSSFFRDRLQGVLYFSIVLLRRFIQLFLNLIGKSVNNTTLSKIELTSVTNDEFYVLTR